MHLQCILLVAASFRQLLSVNAVSPQQAVFGVQNTDTSSQSFIDTSIFGRQHRVQALKALAPLLPTYQIKELDENIEFGIETFAHLNYSNCFSPANNGTFDIAIVGAPFDLGVSYRPGARFGPTGARMGARRLSPAAGWR
jgi:agmatinase